MKILCAIFWPFLVSTLPLCGPGCAGGQLADSRRDAATAGRPLGAEQRAEMQSRCRQTLLDQGGSEAEARICEEVGFGGTWAPDAILWLAAPSDGAGARLARLQAAVDDLYAKAKRTDAPTLRLVRATVSADPIGDTQILALGAGLQASAVVFERRGSLRVMPIMPLTASLLLGPPGTLELNGRTGQNLTAAALAGLADRSLAVADPAGAFVLGGAALAVVPADLAPCSFRGPVHYLRRKAVAQNGGELDDGAQALKEECLQVALSDERELDDQAFLRLLDAIETRRGAAWSQDDLPEEWKSRAGVQKALNELRNEAKALSGRRAELIALLIDELDAFVLQPADVCDEATGQKKAQEKARCQKGLFDLGRRDLSTHVPGGPPPSFQGLDDDYLARLRRKVEDPRDRWRRIDGLNTVLYYLWLATGMRATSPQAQPVCDELVAEIGRQFDQDRWPQAVDRNLSRLSKAMTSTAVCPDRKALNSLYGRVLDEAGRGERGKLGVIVALMSMTPDMFTALLSGQQHKLMVSLEQMHDAVSNQLKGLSQSSEDRALDGILRVFLAIRPALTGRMDQALDSLQQADSRLAGLAFPPPDDAPVLVRIAPGCNLVTGALLAIARHLSGQPAAAASVLARMRERLTRTIPHTMRVLDAAQHAQAALRVAQAIQEMLEMSLATNSAPGAEAGARVTAAIASAWPAIDAQADVWRLGLGAGQIVLADLAALLLDEDLGPAARGQLLAEATGHLDELVQATVGSFGLEGMDWDFIRLLPVAHAVLERYLQLDEDDEQRLEKSLLASRSRLERTLTALAPERPAPARMAHLVERGSLPSVAMEFLWTARQVGLDKLIQNDEQAQRALNARMRQVDDALEQGGRRALRTLVGMCLGILLRGADDVGDAMAWFQRAEEAATGTDLERHMYILAAVRASLLFETDPLAARKLVRTIIARGDRALSCNKTHPVHALYLPMAWMAARSGDGELAQAQIDRYLDLVQKGFPGEAVINCKYTFDSDRLAFTTTISAALTNLIRSTSAEQSFQVGAGGHSAVLNRETFSCTSAPLAYRRHDRALLALLMGASYALLAGDDQQADRRLRQARATWRLIQNGSPATLEPALADGLEASRKHLYRPLMFWTGVLAQLRGHAEIGEEFEAAGRLLASDNSRAEELGLGDDGRPYYLGDLPAAAALRGLMRLWFEQDPTRKGFSKDLLQRIRRAAGEGAAVAASAPVFLAARYSVGQGDFAAAQKVLAGVRAKKDAPPPLVLLAQVVDVLQGKDLPEQAALTGLLVDTAKAGQVPAALKAADALSGTVAAKRGVEAALALFARPHEAVQDQLDLLTHGLAQFALAKLLLSQNQGPAAFQALVGGLTSLNGHIPLQVQLARQLDAIKMGLQLDQLAVTRQLLTTWLPTFDRAMGTDAPLVIQMRAMGLALAAGLDGRADPAAIDALLRLGTGREAELGGAPAFLVNLKKAQAEKAEPAKVKALCRDFLLGVLKG